MSTPSGHGVDKRKPGSKYLSEISPSLIKITNYNPNKDFKSVKRP